MRWMVAVFAVVSALLAAGASLAPIDAPAALDARGPATHPLQAVGRLGQRYNQDGMAMLVARAAPPDGIFNVAALQELRSLVHQLDRSRLCTKVVQFLDLAVPTIGVDETVVQTLVPELPTGASQTAIMRDKVMAYPPVKGQLVAADGAATLILCPLARPDAWQPLTALVDAYKGPALHLTLTGGRGIRRVLAEGLRQSAAVLGVCAVGGIVMALGLQRRRARPSRLVAVGLLGVGVLVLAARYINSATPLDFVTGAPTATVQHALSDIVEADGIVALDTQVDATTAHGLQAVQRFCSALAARTHATVSCPSDVLVQAAAALTGEAQLPHTDEQLRSLWFLIGDTPELALLFTAARDHTLINVHLPANVAERSAPSVAQAAQDLAAPEGLSVEASGLPFVYPWLRRTLFIAAVVAAVGLALAHAGGKRGSRGASLAPLGGAWLVAGALSPVGAMGLLLGIPGVWLLGMSIGAMDARGRAPDTAPAR